ncbi:MAG: hypothetical protein BalsKO_05210 [Balneolaceae bacterium]
MKLYSIRMLLASVVGTLLLFVYACAPSAPMVQAPFTAPSVSMLENVSPPSPDPRVGLGAGLFDAEEAIWNLEMLSTTTPPAQDFRWCNKF